MGVLESLRYLTTQIATAKTATEIGNALYAVGGRFGFTTGLGLDVTKTFDDLGEALLFAGRRDEVEVLHAERPLTQHPLVVHARTTDRPFVMSTVRIENKLTEEQWWACFPSYFRGFDGIVVPVHDKGRLAWYIAFAGLKPDLSPSVVAVLTVAAYAGFERFGQLVNRKVADSPLTEREAECLHLVAQGKTDAEIGESLGISPRTVRFHVGNAKTKLGVTTRIQAVAKQLGAA
jgi:DNA-binding CsgD family transcriptional regulator